ncbi:hypothetical protein J6590_082960 [Homalodisca vitripennis]|nr:hypothetical protein J6590_082960 [Homalodisca vitripennis]
MGRIEACEGKVLVDTGAQVSLIKRGASSAQMVKPDVILRGISGRTLKVYGRQKVSLSLKPGGIIIFEKYQIVIIGGTNDVDKSAPYALTLQQAFRSLPDSWRPRIAVFPIFDRHDVSVSEELKDANIVLVKELVQRAATQERGDIAFYGIQKQLSKAMYPNMDYI